MTNTQDLKEMFEQYTNDMEYLVHLTEDLKDAEYEDDRENIYDSIAELHDETINNMYDLQKEIFKLVDNDDLEERIEQYINDMEYLVHLTEDLKDAEYEDNQRIYDELSNEHDELINDMYDLEKEILELIV